MLAVAVHQLFRTDAGLDDEDEFEIEDEVLEEAPEPVIVEEKPVKKPIRKTPARKTKKQE